MPRLLLPLVAIAVASAPADAQPPAAPAGGGGCAAAEAEKTALIAERAALREAVTDLAMGRRKRRRPGAGAVGGALAGTAATILLPFGIGAAVSAGVGAAARSAGKKKRAREAASVPPPPDPAALVERQQAVDSRLEAIAAQCG